MRDNDPDIVEDDDIDFNPITGRYHLSFEPEQMAHPSMIVVYLVSHITEKSVLSLPPLQRTIETDILQSWLVPSSDRSGELKVSFEYAGYLITLNQEGDIWAESADETTETVNG